MYRRAIQQHGKFWALSSSFLSSHLVLRSHFCFVCRDKLGSHSCYVFAPPHLILPGGRFYPEHISIHCEKFLKECSLFVIRASLSCFQCKGIHETIGRDSIFRFCEMAKTCICRCFSIIRSSRFVPSQDSWQICAHCRKWWALAKRHCCDIPSCSTSSLVPDGCHDC